MIPNSDLLFRVTLYTHKL